MVPKSVDYEKLWSICFLQVKSMVDNVRRSKLSFYFVHLGSNNRSNRHFDSPASTGNGKMFIIIISYYHHHHHRRRRHHHHHC